MGRSSNFGWVPTPQAGVVPTDGSTIQVFIDGLARGNPVYDQFRDDIATAFPGYTNSNGSTDALPIDTTTLTNGVHTIAWSVTDNLGRADGIGSRYFSVLNVP